MKLLTLMIAAAVAGPELAFAQVTEEARCSQESKTFELDNNQTRIQSLQILHGNEFVLHAKDSKDDLVLKCGEGSEQSINAGTKWQSTQEAMDASKAAPSTGLPLLLLPYSKNLQVTSRDEFPIRTSVQVSARGNYITLKDQLAEKSPDLWMECTNGIVSITDMEVFPHKPMFSFPIPEKPKADAVTAAVASSASGCKPSRYAIDLKTGKMRTVEAGSSSASPGSGGATGQESGGQQ